MDLTGAASAMYYCCCGGGAGCMAKKLWKLTEGVVELTLVGGISSATGGLPQLEG